MANRLDMKQLAARGAAVRLAELKAEMDAIRAAFPSLGNGAARGNGQGQPARGGRRAAAVNNGERRERPAMTAAQRKAVSARMKKYWADRRKEKNAAAK